MLRAFPHAPKGGGEVILAPRRIVRAERATAATFVTQSVCRDTVVGLSRASVARREQCAMARTFALAAGARLRNLLSDSLGLGESGLSARVDMHAIVLRGAKTHNLKGIDL